MRRGFKRAGGPFEEVFLNAYPNPDRIGCPDSEVLRGLASKKLPISNPARMHIVRCSPCFREFRGFEKQIAERRRHKLILAGAVAACFMVALVFVRTSGLVYRRPDKVASIAHVPVVIALDFRSLAIRRGEAPPAGVQGPWHVPARLVSLDIILPFGSDDGQYAVEIRNKTSILKKFSGTATIRDGNTQLSVIALDLSGLLPGEYVFLFRHADAQWRRANILIE